MAVATSVARGTCFLVTLFLVVITARRIILGGQVSAPTGCPPPPQTPLQGESRRVRLFLATFAALAPWFASAQPLIWLARIITAPGFVEQLAGIRYPSVAAGLAVPAILALAARGLERVLQRSWPKLRLSMVTAESASPSIALGVRWILAIPLLLAALSFSRIWTQTVLISPDTYAVLNALRTPDLEWVDPPFGASMS
jgi:hypothetical protein